jgi:hypothetical protein
MLTHTHRDTRTCAHTEREQRERERERERDREREIERERERDSKYSHGLTLTVYMASLCRAPTTRPAEGGGPGGVRAKAGDPRVAVRRTTGGAGPRGCPGGSAARGEDAAANPSCPGADPAERDRPGHGRCSGGGKPNFFQKSRASLTDIVYPYCFTNFLKIHFCFWVVFCVHPPRGDGGLLHAVRT